MSNKYSSFKTYKQTLSKRKLVNEKFGIDSNFKWHNDPRQFFISLARYKFVAKMLQKKSPRAKYSTLLKKASKMI